MSTQKNAPKIEEKVNPFAEILSAMNAENIGNKIQSSTTERKRIWTESFRLSKRNGKIGQNERMHLFNFFGRINAHIKAGKIESAKKEFTDLQNWCKGKIQNPIFTDYTNFTNQDKDKTMYAKEIYFGCKNIGIMIENKIVSIEA